MIPAIILAVILCFAALEYLSLFLPARCIQAKVESDLPLCSPDEEITLRYTITNTSFLPMLFVCFSVYFDDTAEIRETEQWQSAHVRRDYSGLHVEHRLRLMPHSRYTGRLRFSLGKRGLHSIGKLYLETGDYLGVRSTVRSEDAAQRIICTASLQPETPALSPLGGLLGDVSVRRFIHEDPCLLSGYREYTGQEPMKQISWMQSAKSGRLIVKQQDHTAEADVAVLLNMDGTPAQNERCLSLTRTVCEYLEEKKIPYSFRSNGDLRPSEKGLGRGHLFPILRGIGLSRLACYTGFGELVERVIAQRQPDRTYIVISATAQEAQLRLLQSHSEHRVYVLGETGGAAT